MSLQSLTTSPAPAEATPPEPTTDVTPQPTRKRRWPIHLLAAAVYIGLGLLVMARFVADPQGQVSGHLANDNTWFQWLLSHGAYSVRHLENPFFSLRQNYPIGVNMMANTSVLGITLPLAPVTMLLGARVTYLLWMVGACAGTAFSAYWVLQRYVVRSRAAAFLGGAFAGFAPGVIHHANGQPNFVSNFVLPFIVLQVLRLGIDRRWLRDGIILGLLVTYQVFINEEILVVTAGACVVAVLAYAALRPRVARQRFKSFLLGSAVTALTAGLLCAYPLWFQFNGPGTFTSLPLYQTWGEDPVTYLTFARDTLVGDPIVEKTMGHPEQNSWFGWPLTTVVVVAILLLWRRSVAVRVAAIVALVFGVLALGPRVRFNGEYPGIRGPWAFIPDDLPVLGLLTPSRLTFAVVGVFALVVALAWDASGRAWEASGRAWEASGRAWDRTTKLRRLGAVLAMTLIAAALIPLIPKPLPAQLDERPPLFITSGEWREYVPDGRTLIPVPLPNKFAGRETLSWSAWTEHEFPVPEGYFLGPDKEGFGKAGTTEVSMLTKLIDLSRRKNYVPKVTPELRLKVRSEIHQWDGSVVVMRARRENANFKILVDQLIGPSEHNLDVWIWKVG